MKRPPHKIHLGFEVGTGLPVSVELGHTVAFGQTQKAGKTTALEAMISRAGVRGIAFRTKRGENAFSNAREILPYLVERTDWRSVQAILESTMKSKQDFKQSWIMRASEGADTLAGVQANVKRLMGKAKPGSMHEDMYYILDHYFDIVIPQIRQLPKTNRVDLAPGLNVMNLEGYSPELQALVISSVIRWVHGKEKGVVTIIPEAWRFLPQGRRSPVIDAAEELVREGAGLRNFMLVDSQDIAGVEKLIIRAATNWLIGVQREKNELKRNLDNIPDGVAKPKKADVATLTIGQFYCCFGGEAIKTYMQPVWMSDADARAIALGEKSIDDVPRPSVRTPVAMRINTRDARGRKRKLDRGTATALAHAGAAIAAGYREQTEQERAPPSPAAATIADPEELTEADMNEIKELRDQMATQHAELMTALGRSGGGNGGGGGAPIDIDGLYAEIKRRLAAEAPALLKVLTIHPEMEVTIETPTINADMSSLLGRIAYLIATGWFKEQVTNGATVKELGRTGNSVNSANVGREFKKLVSMGFLTEEANGFQEVASAKVRINKKK